MNYKFTTFQLKCLERLLFFASHSIPQMEVLYEVGNSENFMVIKLNGAEIHIYEDEVQFMMGKCNLRFERPDYDTDDEMIDEFCKKYSEANMTHNALPLDSLKETHES